jgi:hypothetical protein
MLGRAVGALALVALVAGLAEAQSGIQLTRDGKRTLISKDAGNERWATTGR